MPRRIHVPLILALLTSAAPATATTLIDNVNGLQVDARGRLQRFNGLLIGDDGKVIRLLRAGEVRPKADARIDEHGRAMLPGLIDAHGHIMDLGNSALNANLTGSRSLADFQQRLRSYSAAHPDRAWLIGFGWNQELWPEKRFPTAADLDAVVPDKPVVLERVDGHAVVANSAAMRLAGVTAATTDPAGGRIERDSQGRPTGLFVDAARGLIERKVPAPSAAQEDAALAAAQNILLGYGVTAAGAMSTSTSDWQLFDRTGRAGGLKVRLMSYALGLDPLKVVPRPTGWLYADRLKMDGVKLFADGALGSRGAWLKQPYSDKPDTRGLQFHSDAELLQQADAAASRGFQLATHAIGDAANAQVIGTYEQLSKRYPGDRRWRIEHVQIVDPADLPRIARAGIVASMQPTHQTSDDNMAEARLGPKRLEGAYAWRTIAASGAHLAFGSDFPVESPNPFPGIAAAVSRADPQGQPPGGWRPQERVTLDQALAGFTREAAYAGFTEDRLGSLEPGHWADFIIVDRDIAASTPVSIAATKVLETWVAGKKAWTSGSAPPAK